MSSNIITEKVYQSIVFWLHDLHQSGVHLETKLIIDDGELAIHWPLLQLWLWGHHWWSDLGQARADNVVLLPGVSLAWAQDFVDQRPSQKVNTKTERIRRYCWGFHPLNGAIAFLRSYIIGVFHRLSQLSTSKIVAFYIFWLSSEILNKICTSSKEYHYCRLHVQCCQDLLPVYSAGNLSGKNVECLCSC